VAEIFRTRSDSGEKIYKFGDYFRYTFFVKSSHVAGFGYGVPRIACPAGPSILLLRKITALKYVSIYNYRYRTLESDPTPEPLVLVPNKINLFVKYAF
jgi:hypothetical protein